MPKLRHALDGQGQDTALSAASKRFSRYKREEQRQEREACVRQGRRFESLLAAWKSYKQEQGVYRYRSALRLVRYLGHSSEDVEAFSLMMGSFRSEEGFSEKAGQFLSALINSGRDMDYTVHTRHLEDRIDGLGKHNRKSILVDGDLGKGIGCQMEKGKVRVEGSVDIWVGECMSGGEIIVDGDVHYDVGKFMRGGTIRVKGDAKEVGSHMAGGSISIDGHANKAGMYMEGGRIDLGGTFDQVGSVLSGEIFNKGTRLELRQTKIHKEHLDLRTMLSVIRHPVTLAVSLLFAAAYIWHPIGVIIEKMQDVGDWFRHIIRKARLRREGPIGSADEAGAEQKRLHSQGPQETFEEGSEEGPGPSPLR